MKEILAQKLKRARDALKIRFDQKTEFVKSLSIMQKCPRWSRRDVMTKIRKSMQLRTYLKEQLIMDSTISTFNLYLIWNGEVGCYLEEKIFQKRIRNGEVFGDLAVTFNRACKTSYRALETSQIYVIEKQDIPSILRDFERQFQQRLVLPLFKPCSLFGEWDLGSLCYVNYLGQEKYFVKNQLVYSQGQPAEGIYLIIYGDFSYSCKTGISKLDSSHQNNSRNINQSHTRNNSKDENPLLQQQLAHPQTQIEKQQLSLQDKSKNGEILEIENDESGGGNNYTQQVEFSFDTLKTRPPPKLLTSKLRYFGSGAIFGEDETMMRGNRINDAMCESAEGKVIFLNSAIFFSLIYSNPQSKQVLSSLQANREIIQSKQINYVKSSIQGYDHYLLGTPATNNSVSNIKNKQSSLGNNNTEEIEDEGEMDSFEQEDIRTFSGLKVDNQLQLNEIQLKNRRQKKDKIKNQIEGTSLIQLKKINEQARQFNQYAYDQHEDMFCTHQSTSDFKLEAELQLWQQTSNHNSHSTNNSNQQQQNTEKQQQQQPQQLQSQQLLQPQQQLNSSATLTTSSIIDNHSKQSKIIASSKQNSAKQSNNSNSSNGHHKPQIGRNHSISNQCELDFVKASGQFFFSPKGENNSPIKKGGLSSSSSQLQQQSFTSMTLQPSQTSLLPKSTYFQENITNNNYNNNNNNNNRSIIQEVMEEHEDKQTFFQQSRITLEGLQNNNQNAVQSQAINDLKKQQPTLQLLTQQKHHSAVAKQQIPLKTEDNKNSNNNNNNNNNNNSGNTDQKKQSSQSSNLKKKQVQGNEVFELIIKHNSKTYGRHFTRMKQLIEQGGKLFDKNRKKYFPQVLFPENRSKPTSLMPKISLILQDHQQTSANNLSLQSPMSITTYPSNEFNHHQRFSVCSEANSPSVFRSVMSDQLSSSTINNNEKQSQQSLQQQQNVGSFSIPANHSAIQFSTPQQNTGSQLPSARMASTHTINEFCTPQPHQSHQPYFRLQEQELQLSQYSSQEQGKLVEEIMRVQTMNKFSMSPRFPNRQILASAKIRTASNSAKQSSIQTPKPQNTQKQMLHQLSLSQQELQYLPQPSMNTFYSTQRKKGSFGSIISSARSNSAVHHNKRIYNLSHDQQLIKEFAQRSKTSTELSPNRLFSTIDNNNNNNNTNNNINNNNSNNNNNNNNMNNNVEINNVNCNDIHQFLDENNMKGNQYSFNNFAKYGQYIQINQTEDKPVGSQIGASSSLPPPIQENPSAFENSGISYQQQQEQFKLQTPIQQYIEIKYPRQNVHVLLPQSPQTVKIPPQISKYPLQESLQQLQQESYRLRQLSNQLQKRPQTSKAMINSSSETGKETSYFMGNSNHSNNTNNLQQQQHTSATIQQKLLEKRIQHQLSSTNSDKVIDILNKISSQTLKKQPQPQFVFTYKPPEITSASIQNNELQVGQKQQNNTQPSSTPNQQQQQEGSKLALKLRPQTAIKPQIINEIKRESILLQNQQKLPYELKQSSALFQLPTSSKNILNGNTKFFGSFQKRQSQQGIPSMTSFKSKENAVQKVQKDLGYNFISIKTENDF